VSRRPQVRIDLPYPTCLFVFFAGSLDHKLLCVPAILVVKAAENGSMAPRRSTTR
jgi:hypothetical protein